MQPTRVAHVASSMEISKEFPVFNVPGGCCLGVSCGETRGELIVTFKSGTIQVYNVRIDLQCLLLKLKAIFMQIHDLKMVCSWQLSSSQELVCGAIHHPDTGQYWAIGNQVLSDNDW